MSSTFLTRLRSRELLIGTWIKTPSPVVCEVLARSGLDTLALDAEHAPFGRQELDNCLAIGAALGMPMLVRLPSADSAQILNALDCGAAGVVIPHVRSAADAAAIVRAAHYGPGGRGYAGSTRAAGFAGRSIGEHITKARSSTAVILQIEDHEALSEIDAIAATPGVDCLFVGRIDLTVSLGKTDPQDAAVVAAVERICAAGRAANVAVGMFVPQAGEAARWRAQGASLFILSSDQTFLIGGAKQLVAEVRKS